MADVNSTREKLDPNAAETLLPFVPETARRILDCDCGRGERGAQFKARGARVTGLTADATAAEAAREVLDEVVAGDLQTLELPFEDGAFDCIVCADVLARLKDPAPFLARLPRVLAGGGLLLATAPNVQYYETVLMLADGQWEYGGSGVMAREHLRFFTAYSLVQLLTGAGFQVQRCGVLSGAPPEAFPRDADGCVRLGRYTIGPLSDDKYKAYLAEYYILFARAQEA